METANQNKNTTRLEQAKSLIQRSMSFGDAYIYIIETDDEKLTLKDWYVKEPSVPVSMVSRELSTSENTTTATGVTHDGYGVKLETITSQSGQPLPTLSQKSSREEGYTGDVCATCGSMKMIRTGTCQTCQDCYSTSGCG